MPPPGFRCLHHAGMCVGIAGGPPGPGSSGAFGTLTCERRSLRLRVFRPSAPWPADLSTASPPGSRPTFGSLPPPMMLSLRTQRSGF